MKPAVRAENAQGGARLNATTGRVDWSASVYTGFEPFAMFELLPSTPGGPLLIAATHPRFTMVGGDFETVSGPWGVRGEVAAFVDDNFQTPSVAVVGGSSLDAGVGVDRKAGSYRVSGTVLFHRESYDTPPQEPAGDGTLDRSSVSLVLSTDRSFARERYQVRVFGVGNATDGTGFFRAIATADLRDNLELEGSAGWFAGSGEDTVGRLSDSDFTYLRLKYYF
jgi:hypothetical protein